MSNIVLSEKFIKSDVVNNNNKFWYVDVYSDGRVVTTYGRVGDTGATNTIQKSSEAEAIKFAEGKIREKLRDGRNGEIAYRPLNTVASVEVKRNDSSLEDIAMKQIIYDEKAKEIIKYLIAKNIHNIVANTTITYNAQSGLFETPLGVVTQDCVDKAKSLLIKIGNYIRKQDLASKEYGSLLNDYLMLIPQNVGRKLNQETLYTSQEDVKKQYEILESLEASLATIAQVRSSDSGSTVVEQERIFNTELKVLTDRDEFARINRYFENSKKHNHASSTFKLKRVYILKIDNVVKRYESKGKKIGNIKELWHGSKAANIISIMKSGLVIPPASASFCTGRMFGSDGGYFANSSTKSLNYSCGYWDGSRENKCFMFLVDAACGKAFQPRSSDANLRIPDCYDSIHATPDKISSLINEEFIVPLHQVNLKYLCEFEK